MGGTHLENSRAVHYLSQGDSRSRPTVLPCFPYKQIMTMFNIGTEDGKKSTREMRRDRLAILYQPASKILLRP